MQEPFTVLLLTKRKAGHNIHMVTRRKNLRTFLHSHESTPNIKANKTPPVISPMKICPFYLIYSLHIVPLHSDYIHLYMYYSNSHISTTRRLVKIDIDQFITVLTDILTYVPYSPYPTKPTFYSTLTSFFHVYDNNFLMELTRTRHYSDPPPNITQPRNTRHHRSIYTNQNNLVPSSYHIRPNNSVIMVYTHGLIKSLPRETTYVTR